MVLAVNVVGDRAAQRHEARARRRRQEASGGNQHGEALGKRDAGLGADDACFAVEGDQPVDAGHVDQPAAGIEVAVAIRAHEADGEPGIGGGKAPDQAGQLIGKGRLRQAVRRTHDAAPRDHVIRLAEAGIVVFRGGGVQASCCSMSQKC